MMRDRYVALLVLLCLLAACTVENTVTATPTDNPTSTSSPTVAATLTSTATAEPTATDEPSAAATEGFATPTPIQTQELPEVTPLGSFWFGGFKYEDLRGYVVPYSNRHVRYCPYVADWCPVAYTIYTDDDYQVYGKVTHTVYNDQWLCLDEPILDPDGVEIVYCTRLLLWLECGTEYGRLYKYGN